MRIQNETERNQMKRMNECLPQWECLAMGWGKASSPEYKAN